MRIVHMTAVLALLLAPPARAQERACVADAGPSQLGVLSIDCRECDVFTGEDWVQFHREPVIGDIEHGSPADGVLRPGDVLLRVNGQAITTIAAARVWSRPRAGEPAQLELRREDRIISTVLYPRPLCEMSAQPARKYPARMARNVNVDGLGVGLQCARSCTSSYTNGFVVWWQFSEPPTIATIMPSGRAERAGLLVGDRILQIDGRVIDTEAGGGAFVALLRGTPAELVIERRGERHVLAVPLTP